MGGGHCRKQYNLMHHYIGLVTVLNTIIKKVDTATDVSNDHIAATKKKLELKKMVVDLWTRW